MLDLEVLRDQVSRNKNELRRLLVGASSFPSPAGQSMRRRFPYGTWGSSGTMENDPNANLAT
jgi:hypothetical protein